MKVISVENLHKKFILKRDRPKNIAEALKGMFSRQIREDFWALKGVSFGLREGEAIGLIGHNGAGKSTMLKILTGIMEPTSGAVLTRGRVSALIEVGAGFHQEMTGREDIYLNGAILGMTRTEIDKKLEAIIDFSEIRNFIDTPVKRYSSGMYARLGFSVAAHVEPQILLVDEVLAVGDLAFQQKCMRHMKGLAENGCAVILVTHSMYSARRLCSRLIWFHHGEVKMDGPAEDVALAYQAWAGQQAVEGAGAGGSRWGAGGVKIHSVEAIKHSLENEHSFDVDVVADIEAEREISEPVLWVMITNPEGFRIAGTTTRRQPGFLPRLNGRCEVRCKLRGLSLLPGSYRINVGVFDNSLVPLDRWGDCASIVVDPDETVEGLITHDFDGSVYTRSDWSLSES